MSSVATVTHTTLSNAPNIDPREKMVQQLKVQNESLFDTLDKVSEVYEAASKEKDSAIESLANTNEELRAKLALAQGQLKEMAIAHEAEARVFRAAQMQQSRAMVERMLAFCDKALTREASGATLQEVADWKKDIDAVPVMAGAGPWSQQRYGFHAYRLLPELQKKVDLASALGEIRDAQTKAEITAIKVELLKMQEELCQVQS